jgi:SNF2 family DNA or RNA helicase
MRIELQFDYEKRNIPSAAGLKFNKDSKTWRGQLTLMGAYVLYPHVAPPVQNKINNWLGKFNYEIDIQSSLRDITPMAHQEAGASAIKALKKYGAFFDMGTGKTVTTLLAIQDLFYSGDVETVLVLAPLAVIPEWEHQMDRFMTVPVNYLRLHHKKKAKREELIDEFLTPRHELSVGLINYESLSSILEYDPTFSVDMIVADESTRIKNRNANATKAAIKISDRAEYTVALSGTPMPNGVHELYSQIRFLSKKYVGNSYWKFADRYLEMGGFQGKQIVGEKNQEELRTVISYFSRRLRKEDVLDLPEKVYTKLEVNLIGEQKDAYESAQDDFLFAVDAFNQSNQKVTDYSLVKNALHRLSVCQRIASGHITNEDGEILRFDKNPKLAALSELLGDFGDQPIIISARFHEDIEIIYEAVSRVDGRTPVKYHGGIPNNVAEKNLKKFQSGKADTFIMQVQKGSYGINLTVADTIVIWNNWFSYGTRDQLESRTHRKGQTNHCHYIDLVAHNTVDEAILESIAKKQSISEALFGVKIDYEG